MPNISKEFATISITDYGAILPCSGLRSYDQVLAHLQDRLNSPTRYMQFMVVHVETVAGIVTMTNHNLTPKMVARLIERRATLEG